MELTNTQGKRTGRKHMFLPELEAIVRENRTQDEPTQLAGYKSCLRAYLTDPICFKKKLSKKSLLVKQNVLLHACLFHVKPFVEFLADGIVDIDAPLSAVAYKQTVLSFVCGAGKLPAVQTLLALGANIRIRDEQGDTALHAACDADNAEIITLLLDKGVSVEERGYKGMTPLIRSAQANKCAALEVLLDRGAQIDFIVGEYGTALYQASMHGHLDALKVLLKRGAHVDAYVSGGTVFYACIWKKRFASAQLLLESGANINVRDPENHTPLFLACSYNNVAGVEFLLKAGAEVNETDSEQQSPLDRACLYNSVDVVPLLLAHGADVNRVLGKKYIPLFLASIKSGPEIIRMLVAADTDRDCLTHKLNTALYFACCNNKLENVKALVELGASVDARMEKVGATAFHSACQCADQQMVEYILELRPDVYVLDAGGSTALHHACLNPRSEMIDYLHKKGIALDAQNYAGWSPLHVTARHGNVKGTQYLLKMRPDLIDARCARGGTPLIFAASQQMVDVVRILLDAGADVHAETVLGATALDYAVDLNNQSIIDLIEQHKAHQVRKNKNAKKKLRKKNKKNNAAVQEPVEQPTVPAECSNANDNNTVPVVEHAVLLVPEKVQEVETLTAQEAAVSLSEYHIAFDGKFKWPKGISDKEQRGICQKLEQFNSSHVDVKKLKNNDGHYRLRYGKYRIIFTWDNANKKIDLLKIALRKKAYKIAIFQ